MKKLFLILLFAISAGVLSAQAVFDLGLKGGANFSKISFDLDNYSSESVVKTHFGAFGRIGFSRIFIQPEVYFSGKGGELTSVTSTITSFDFGTLDIPVLLGVKLIKNKAIDFHLTGGPVFSKIINEKVEGDDLLDKSFYEKHYFGIQYGLGIDVLFLTFDARMENALNDFYTHPGGTGKNSTFMLSIGFKIL